MADVDMTDVSPPAPSKAKALAKGAKAGGSAETGSDGKKRFEVKKVRLSRLWNYWWEII